MQYLKQFKEKYGEPIKVTKFAFANSLTKALKKNRKKAIKELLDKARKLKIKINLPEIIKEAEDKANTVATIMLADILQDIYNNIQTAKNKGETKPVFGFEIEALLNLANLGWTGKKPYRLQTILDTNVSVAHAEHKLKQQNLIANLYPYWQYQQIERPTKRHDHAIFHNKIFRHDDPIWQLIYPPTGFGCKCSVIPLRNAPEVDNGEKYTNFVKQSEEFDFSPLKKWQPDIDKYANKIKNKLKILL